MSVSYALAVKNARLAATVALLDGGPDVAQLVIGTSALAGLTGVLVTIPLLKPSFSVSGGVMSISGAPLVGVATGNGAAALAELRDSNGVTLVSNLTIGPSGTDFILGNPNITVGMAVTVLTGAIQHA